MTEQRFEGDAAATHHAGHVFRASANGVWLAEGVPPACIEPPRQ